MIIQYTYFKTTADRVIGEKVVKRTVLHMVHCMKCHIIAIGVRGVRGVRVVWPSYGGVMGG